MFTKLFDFVPGFVWALLLAVLAAMLGVQTIRYNKLEREYASYAASIVKATLQAEQEARKKEQELRQQVERIAANAQAKQQEFNRRSADLSRVLSELRDRIKDLNSRAAPADPIAAAIFAEARRARELLGACSEEYSTVARRADELSDQVTGLQEYAASVSKQ